MEICEFIGQHIVASFKDCDPAGLLCIDGLRAAMQRSAEATGATILSGSEHRFDNDGFTMVLLLSESHASIHTYPEYKSCFVDIFTCGSKCDPFKFISTLREWLKPEAVKMRVIDRD